MKILALAFLLTACGGAIKVKGGTTNTVETKGETKITFAVDLTSCQEFDSPEDRSKCLDLMIELLATLEDLKSAADEAQPSE